MSQPSPETPWVLVRVRDQFFGLPATHVREMADMPKVTRVPDTPEYVLGLITLRGQVIPAVDLRRRMGYPTMDQDLSDITRELDVAEQEHLHQLQEYDATLSQSTPARGKRKARVCPLRAWFDSSRAGSGMAMTHLKRLDGPDSAFHAGLRAMEEMSRGRKGEAVRAALADLKTKEMADLSRAFAQARERLQGSRRQIVVVVDWDHHNLGLAVDQVESIERLKPGSLEELPQVPTGLVSELTTSVGKRTRDDGLALLLEIPALFRGTPSAEVPLEESVAGSDAERQAA
jgi:chemotaxis signal transduction protein